MRIKLLRLLTELSSRRWISRLAGYIANSNCSRRIIPLFIKIYKIKLEEAEKPLQQYRTLNEFFTRRLKPGVRLFSSSDDQLISPVDACITAMGWIQAGCMFNIKGQDYTIDELLHFSPQCTKYKAGYYFVLYLSPSDYHRIHSPVNGATVKSQHISGRVYPVNHFGLRHMPRVLSRNERLLTYLRHATGEIALVKVGALNVSSIRYTNDRLESFYTQGQDLAYFQFGSTVVVITENDTFIPHTHWSVGEKVKIGDCLGTLTNGNIKCDSSAEKDL